MKILSNKKWQDGFLDYHQCPKEYRIQVLAWKNLEKIQDAYYIRPKSLKMALRYLPVVGFYGLFTKAWSRLREQRRNDKYVSCGIGKIIETGNNLEFKKNETIAFIAPFHPQLVESLSLPQELIFNIDKNILPLLSSDEILQYPLEQKDKINQWWQEIISWSIYSGKEISAELKEKLEQNLIEEIKNTQWNKCQELSIQNSSKAQEIKGKVKKLDSRKTGVLFGFGNYAKTNIISFMKPFVNITTIHEIDPTQIWEKSAQKWDTSPFPREDEKYDVYFVASYNHTHEPIAQFALKQGAYAVVEKPVAMDYEELAEIEKTIKEVGSKIFIGFHKRYSIFNDWAIEDLNIKHGQPISYHSVVYEISQPKYFWYSWPISRSTFFGNGCHQIDHFLHLNDFSQPKDFDIKLLQDNAIEVWIELENGAVFTTVFSEKGSTRIGPRDHVELKVPGGNVRITDNIFYLSENETRAIRKRRMFKTNSYRNMYIKIGEKIANNDQGDSLKSIMVSTKLMLDLEEKLQKQKGWGNQYLEAKKRFWQYFEK